MIKKKQKKLKYSLWLYFMLFAAIIIGSLWLFQMLFLDGYYQTAKLREMAKSGNVLRQTEYTDPEFMAEAQKCAESGITVYVVRGDDDVIYYLTGLPVTSEESKDLISSTLSSLLKHSTKDIYCQLTQSDVSSENYFVYATESQVDANTYVVMTSAHRLVDQMSKVIRWQFITISILIAIAGFFIAWYLSGKLANPISEMSIVAKKWANGDDTVTFESNGKYSEIAELADALNYAKLEISKAGNLQRDLLANVSHDLKTPLTMIKAYAEMINDFSGDFKDKREKHTQIIIEEADRLALLVNDILNLSKLQSAVESVKKEKINLSELTERVIGRFSVFAQTQGYKIEDNIAPNLLTMVDEAKIEQVIYNLLSNSINYTGEDKTVKVYLTAENDKILLEVIDSGKGISEEKLATIWERYYRYSETNTRPVKGTGLGLSIVKAILDNHGLKFGVRSKKDCGSNFYVEFERIKNE